MDGRKAMANVGSVGEPRDKSGCSCYAIVDYEENGADNKIEFRRLPLVGKATTSA